MKTAKQILSSHLSEFGKLSHQLLAPMIGQIITRVDPPYQIEIQLFWDDHPGGTIRIVGCIDNGSLVQSIKPTTESLLIESPGNTQ
ncbi:MAG: hypothetical protein EP312_03160 [Gammaproteobacteria bacterium]|nr:MAG: hypothetical protein EP312_03160 [Gammaproteobacteria bacterium]